MPKPRHINADERRLLERFVRLEIDLDELLLSFRDMLELNFTPAVRCLTSHFLVAEPGVAVTLRDIENAKAKYATREISRVELIRWATMILLYDAYEWQGPEEDAIANTLNDLSMPQLFPGAFPEQ